MDQRGTDNEQKNPEWADDWLTSGFPD